MAQAHVLLLGGSGLVGSCARDRWASVGSSAGSIKALKPAFNLSGFEPKMGAVPALGEHTRALLAELGYAQDEIERLSATGVI